MVAAVSNSMGVNPPCRFRRIRVIVLSLIDLDWPFLSENAREICGEGVGRVGRKDSLISREERGI
jgi:hypothetical protein